MKPWLKNLLALSISLVFCIAILEVAGRTLPIRMGFGEGMDYLQFSPTLGFEIDPGVGSINYRNSCVDIENISINSAGMRSADEYSFDHPDDSPRIAVLGDSFMTGREVSDGEDTAAIMNRQLSAGDALNFGVPGYGTIQSLITYEEKARLYSPDIVVLAFLEVNDIDNNSAVLSSMGEWEGLRPTYREDGSIVQPSLDRWKKAKGESFTGAVHRNLTRYSYTYYAIDRVLLKRLFRRLRGPADPGDQSLAKYWWGKDSLLMHGGVYETSPDPIWQRAWSDTERAISELNEAVTRDGGKLIVMLLPSTGSAYSEGFAGKYEEIIGKPLPESIDLTYPRRRLGEFSARNGIAFLDLNREFERYARLNELKKPNFYFMCDGHFNPLGHYLTAHSLLGRLITEQWLKPDNLSMPERYQNGAFMDLTPEQLLGEEAFGTVYGWRKTYRGNSDAINH